MSATVLINAAPISQFLINQSWRLILLGHLIRFHGDGFALSPAKTGDLHKDAMQGASSRVHRGTERKADLRGHVPCSPGAWVLLREGGCVSKQKLTR